MRKNKEKRKKIEKNENVRENVFGFERQLEPATLRLSFIRFCSFEIAMA